MPEGRPDTGTVREASEGEVRLALGSVTVWPVELDPDDRYVGPAHLDGVAGRICERLGGAPERVGESTYLLGLAARVWSATVVPAVRHGVLPDPSALVVRDDDGAVHLGMREPRGWREVSPADVHREVVGALRPIVDASRLSPRLMWGNVASALAAVPRVCGLPAAHAWVVEMLELPPLRGEMSGGRRTTCCLFYEAGGGLCGDCVLDRVPVRPAPAPG
jgi:hypothetical protein